MEQAGLGSGQMEKDDSMEKGEKTEMVEMKGKELLELVYVV